ncbi:MAG: hypothetical protein ACOVP4_08835 [Bacteriovoracaceae bacterium]
MKIKILAIVILLLTGHAWSQAESKGGGGNDIHHMASLEALNEKDFKKILADDGFSFMSKTISPTLWTGFQYLIDNNKTDLDNDEYWAIFKRHPSVKRIWQEFFKNGLEDLLIRIEQTKIKNCSCSHIVEKESQHNQMCAVRDSISKEAVICLDLSKILNPNEKLFIDTPTLIGSIWHELGHLHLKDIEHQDLYTFGIKMKGQASKEVLRKSSSKVECKINKVDFPRLSKTECLMKAKSEGKKSKISFKDGKGEIQGDPSLWNQTGYCRLRDFHPDVLSSTFTEARTNASRWTHFEKQWFMYSGPYKGISFYQGTGGSGDYYEFAFEVKNPETCLKAFNHGFGQVRLSVPKKRILVIR